MRNHVNLGLVVLSVVLSLLLYSETFKGSGCSVGQCDCGKSCCSEVVRDRSIEPVSLGVE